LLKHPWVENPEELDKNLNEIWLGYLKTVNGLIIYDGNKFNKYSSEELKEKFIPYRIAQNQIILIKKGESPPPDEETEVQ